MQIRPEHLKIGFSWKTVGIYYDQPIVKVFTIVSEYYANTTTIRQSSSSILEANKRFQIEIVIDQHFGCGRNGEKRFIDLEYSVYSTSRLELYKLFFEDSKFTEEYRKLEILTKPD